MLPSTLRQELAAVFGEVAAARRMLAAGRAIDLTGLDRRVAVLCEQVALLPVDEGRDLIPLLQDLDESFTQLGGTLARTTTGETCGELPP